MKTKIRQRVYIKGAETSAQKMSPNNLPTYSTGILEHF